MAAQVKRTAGWPVSDRGSPQATLLTGTRRHGGLSIRANLGEVDTQELHKPPVRLVAAWFSFFPNGCRRTSRPGLAAAGLVSILGRLGVAGDSQAKRQITD